MQEQVAESIGVHFCSVQNWERGITEPAIIHLPKIIEFLGYDPVPEPAGLPLRIAYARRRLGYTQEVLASTLQVDPATIYRWENSHAVPSKATLYQIQSLLGDRFILQSSRDE